ncbi:hypothetical protein GCM10009678_71700 [Actinomadura kijaniata]|uniref:Uncharacterized protein n=1 Tax=Actinomadura namibiensis TaxID=182080 RepID=A0A7W3QNP1_ACTNM|nr:hypothetical protein [Actinomadura namibiensis]
MRSAGRATTERSRLIRIIPGAPVAQSGERVEHLRGGADVQRPARLAPKSPNATKHSPSSRWDATGPFGQDIRLCPLRFASTNRNGPKPLPSGITERFEFPPEVGTPPGACPDMLGR